MEKRSYLRGDVSECVEPHCTLIGYCYDRAVNPCSMHEGEPIIAVDGWDDVKAASEDLREILRACTLVYEVFDPSETDIADEEVLFNVKEEDVEDFEIQMAEFCRTQDIGLLKEMMSGTEAGKVVIYKLNPFELLALQRGMLEDFNGMAFTDEYASCQECESILRTSPTHYGWTPEYWLSDYGYVCTGCFKDNEENQEAFMESVVRSIVEETAIPVSPVPLEDLGYEPLQDSDGIRQFETGFHQGMDDSPMKLARKIYYGTKEEDRIIPLFTTNPSQFYISFEIYVKQGRAAEACAILAQAAPSELVDSPSPAEIAMDTLKNGPVTTVSAEDFVEGKMPKAAGKYVIG